MARRTIAESPRAVTAMTPARSHLLVCRMPHSHLPVVCDRNKPLFEETFRRGKMTPDERERMTFLCDQIAVEKNHLRFMELVQELNDLLSKKQHRMSDSTSQSQE